MKWILVMVLIVTLALALPAQAEPRCCVWVDGVQACLDLKPDQTCKQETRRVFLPMVAQWIP